MGFESSLFTVVRRVKPTWFSALVAAHRGCSQDAPENTLASISRAIDVGADLVEFDVHVSADGDVVVIHDERVDRTTDGSGEVARLGTGEIRALDAGSWFSDAYAGEQVPLLDEVLDLLKGRAVPLIEIKAKRKRAPDCGTRVIAALERHRMLDEAVVICRDKERAREVTAASPVTPLAYLTFTKRGARGASRLAGIGGLDIYWKSLSLGLVSDLRRRAGFFLTPWTVNRRADQERLLLLGLETLITDSPGALRDLIERFEFARAAEVLARYHRTGEDVDLESDAASAPVEGLEPDEEVSDAELAASDDVRDEIGTDSEVDLR